ncbi:MAG: enoyl-CoA hydratase/isomerase family protein [Beijerinckiaceae bacterium]|nr:enoyl-CoA hydratase/isomerase family protein [Beijerinckiaceae bacterium]
MSLIEIERDGAVATLWLNRPDVLNALSAALQDELIATIERLDADEHIAVLVLAGRGRAFSAGSDRTEIGVQGPAPSGFERGERLTRTIVTARVIIIVAVHGFCVGGALSILLAADMALAAEGTQFFIPELDLGMPYLWRSTPLLVATAGLHRAKALILTCERFDAAAAERYGIVHRVIAENDLHKEAATLAQLLAAKPRKALEDQKRLANRMALAMMAQSDDEIGLLVAR